VIVNTAKVGIIGIGNVLMGDDAAGLYFIKLLNTPCTPSPQVALVDGGTAGLSLPDLMAEFDVVILVDTVQSEDAPGTVRRYGRAELLDAPFARAMTPHDSGLRDALLLSELGRTVQEVVLVGVVPERMEPGVGLSPAVRDAMDALMDAVLEELERLGVAVVGRETPLAPDLWWERSP
jgi:hydrogenase maturation protease